MNDKPFIYIEDQPDLGMINTARLTGIQKAEYNEADTNKPFGIRFYSYSDPAGGTNFTFSEARYSNREDRNAAFTAIMDAVRPVSIRTNARYDRTGRKA
jgi:hypothetical protein